MPRPLPAAALLVLLAVPVAPAAEPEAVSSRLTPKLDRLLREEMRAILGAMDTIFRAIVTGRHAIVADRARRIHDSFILKRSLTPQDRADLKAAVPSRFLALDRRFHQAAAELARAAEAGDSDREMAVYGRMGEACVTCHRDYAGGRFPGLDPGG